MKVALVIFVLALGALAQPPKPHMSCAPTDDFAFWDLRSLQAVNETDFKAYFNDQKTGDYIEFSLCQPTPKPCSDSSSETHAKLLSHNEQRCTSLSGTEPTDVTFKIHENNRSSGLAVTLRGGTGNTYLILNINCASEQKTGKARQGSTNQEYIVDIDSPAGCPTLDVKPVVDYMTGQVWFIKGGLIVVGLALTFLGLQLLKPAFFILGFGATFVITTYGIFAFFITATTPMWLLWTLLAICTILALIVGLLATFVDYIGNFLAGYGLSYALSTLIMNTFLVPMKIPRSDLIAYAIMAIAGTVFGLLMVKFRKPILILATSLFGSLMFSRAFLSWVGNLPSEPEMIELIQKQLPIPMIVWVYIACNIFMAVAGIAFQKSRLAKEDNDATVTINQYSNPATGYYYKA